MRSLAATNATVDCCYCCALLAADIATLNKAVFLHKQGRLFDRTFENQTYRASGLNLVTAAIVHRNTLYLGRAVDHLRSAGKSIPDELLSHIAPLGWNHISLTGDYLLSETQTLDDGFRPLNILDAAA